MSELPGSGPGLTWRWRSSRAAEAVGEDALERVVVAHLADDLARRPAGAVDAGELASLYAPGDVARARPTTLALQPFRQRPVGVRLRVVVVADSQTDAGSSTGDRGRWGPMRRRRREQSSANGVLHVRPEPRRSRVGVLDRAEGQAFSTPGHDFVRASHCPLEHGAARDSRGAVRKPPTRLLIRYLLSRRIIPGTNGDATTRSRAAHRVERTGGCAGRIGARFDRPGRRRRPDPGGGNHRHRDGCSEDGTHAREGHHDLPAAVET